MSLFGMPPYEPPKEPKIKNGRFYIQSVYTDFEITNLREIVASIGKRGYIEEIPLVNGGYTIKFVLDSKCYYEYILFEMNKIKKRQDEFKLLYNKKTEKELAKEREEKIVCGPDIDWGLYDQMRYNGGPGLMY